MKLKKPEWENTNFYQTLQVSQSATQEEIKKSYKKMARLHHPDANKDDKKSEERFKEINKAYTTLSNADERKKYDTYLKIKKAYTTLNDLNGHENYGNRFTQSNNSDRKIDDTLKSFITENLFGNVFGGNTKPHPSMQTQTETPVPLKITFAESYTGTVKKITTEQRKVPCSACNQSGLILDNEIRTCQNCNGTGVNNETKTVHIKIPKSVKNGQKIKTPPHQGESTMFTVVVENDSTFKREQDNLTTTLPITLPEAHSGAKVTLNLPGGGSVTIKVPPQTNSGTKLRIKNKGFQRKNKTYGDLLVTVHIHIPPKEFFTPEMSAVVEEYKNLTKNYNPRELYMDETRT